MGFIYDLKETIILNNKELLQMKKEYMLVYIKSLFLDLYGTKRRKQLKKCFDEYADNIKLENLYLQMIIDNMEYLDEENAEQFIYKLDIINKDTYEYNEKVLINFENSIFQEDNKPLTLPYKETKPLCDSYDYYLEALNMFIVPKDIDIKQDSQEINKILSKRQK